MGVSQVGNSEGFSAFKDPPGKVSWKDPSGATREISYTIVPKGVAARTDAKSTVILMAGNERTTDPSLATHAIVFRTKDLSSMSQREQDAVINTIFRRAVRQFEEAHPQPSPEIKKSFAEVSEKLEVACASVLPLLQKGADQGKELRAKLTFYHEGTKYKIECQLNKDGSTRLLCIGGKLGSGGESTVLKMVGIEIPQKLQGATHAWAGVYYKPLEEDRMLLDAKNQLVGQVPEGSPEREEIAALAEKLRKLSKKNPEAPGFEAQMTPEGKKELAKVKKEELAVYKKLKNLLGKQPNAEKLLDLLDNIPIRGHSVAQAKMDRRISIANGYAMGKILQDKKVPHLMKYYGVRVKGGSTVASMAKLYDGDLTAITKNPPRTPAERLKRLQQLKSIAETVQAVHDAGMVIVDFKPANILQDEEGVYLADLAGITEEGKAVGESTPFYADPSMRLKSPADKRADLYSLGLIMFEMLHGPLDPASFKPAEDARGKLNPEDPADQMIGELLQEDKAGRLSAGEVLGVLWSEVARVEGEVAEEKQAEEAPAEAPVSEAGGVSGIVEEEEGALDESLFAPVQEMIASSLASVAQEKTAPIDVVAASPQTASPEQVEKAVKATKASTMAVSALGKFIPGTEIPPSDDDTVVNGHRLFVGKKLVVVGDVKASGSEAETTKEINDTLEAVLESPKVSETVKQNIRVCREQGKVRTMDSERTEKVEKEAPMAAAERLSAIREYDGSVKVYGQLKEKIEDVRNNPEAPRVEVRAASNAYRQIVGEEMLGLHPELKLAGRMFDLENGYMIDETASGRIMFNRHVDKEKARELIKNSSLSPEEKDELLKKLDEGVLEIPTEEEDKEIQRRTDALLQEFTAWIEAELAKLQKEEETSKLARALSSPKGILPIRMPSRETIEKMSLIDLAGLIVVRELSRERARQETFLTEERRKRDYEHKEEIKYLEKEAALTAQYFIKEYLKILVKKGKYTEQELKREVAKWLLTSREGHDEAQ